MNRFYAILCAICLSVCLLSGCVSVPFEVAGDVIGASFDVAGAVVEVPFEVAGAVLDVPGDIIDSSWEGDHNHRLQHKYSQHWDMDAVEISRIMAETRNGSIKVMASEDSHIHIDAQINIYSRYKDDAIAFAEKIGLEPKQDGSELVISTHNPQPPKHVWQAAHFTIYTPREMDLQLNTTNGLIAFDDTIGNVHAHTTNGEIISRNTSGSIVARSTNGKIDLNELSGDFDAHTTNGKIIISAKELMNPSSAETTNANINIQIANGIMPLRITTTNGSIDAALPVDFNGTLNAETTNGSVRSEIPVTVHEAKRNQLKGSLGDGGSAEVFIRSTNGSIHIQKNETPYATASR